MVVDASHPYANKARTRKLAGGITAATLSDTELDEIIMYSDDMVDSETGKSDWAVTDALYSLVTAASEFFAASRIRDMFSDPDEVSNDMYQTALDICMRIVKAAASSGDGGLGPGVVIRSKGYSSFPMNQINGEYYSSVRGNSFIKVNETDDSI